MDWFVWQENFRDRWAFRLVLLTLPTWVCSEREEIWQMGGVEREGARMSSQLPDKEGTEKAAVTVKEIRAINEMPWTHHWDYRKDTLRAKPQIFMPSSGKYANPFERRVTKMRIVFLSIKSIQLCPRVFRPDRNIWVDSRTWQYHSHATGFPGMIDARVKESWRLAPGSWLMSVNMWQCLTPYKDWRGYWIKL